MDVILAFDTETTGLPDWRAPSESAHQPHLVQLAMILLDDDHTEQASVSLIIKPDGWTIPDDVAALHGITTEKAHAFGVPEKLAARLFAEMLYATSARGVGHNVDFDMRIMRIALLRAGFDKSKLDARKPETFCTMKAATPVVNLPPTPKMVAAGFNKPKSATLTECIRHFFDEPLEGAHDALVDVRACVRLFRHLMTAELRVADVGDVV
jgi:DNA polymerase-3 subunit epsilon